VADARAVQRVVIGILVLNLAVAAAKAAYGAISGSLAVTSDALHSILDAASNVGALMVLRVAAAPPDAGHPYGHRKVEIVAAAMVGILISTAAGGSRGRRSRRCSRTARRPRSADTAWP
jgi:divalent metal cation (Fe/Co/Zn/Cd) transporter